LSKAVLYRLKDTVNLYCR